MKAIELRKKYLDFFRSKGHSVISSASLIPENDPSVLFTTAGMHPLVPFLLGEKHPGGKRLTNYQRCIRTGDIAEVGDNWHLTFFEMLGNWSLGDLASPDGIGEAGYWKKEAIEWSFEFLTKELHIPSEKLAISVFAGDEDAPLDKETHTIWKSLGIPDSRIYLYGKKDNWWGPAGKTGPCGPDTEMFYITDKKPCGPDCQPSDNCGRYSEIWNDVFMEYNKTAGGRFEPLKQKNVDTGMGLERTIAVLNGKDNVYDTELFVPVMKKIDELSEKDDLSAKRIIADHIRAACFILAEGIVPSNLDQGYVLRRLIRRSIRQARFLEAQDTFICKVAETIVNHHSSLYHGLKSKLNFINREIQGEEERFSKTLERGLKYIQKNVESWEQYFQNNSFIGGFSFIMYERYGFPPEMTLEELKKYPKVRKQLNEKEYWFHFNRRFKEHQELSRKGAKKKFAGGLADHSAETIKLHTATHLLHQALRIVLGNHVFQKGSNITPERLRFDFTHPAKMTAEEIAKVKNLVNKQIKKDLPVSWKELTVAEAKKRDAIGLFEEKYGDKVKVYQVGNFSLEICGGPHVAHTGQLGSFKIIKEEAVSAGIRRIKAKTD